MYSPHLLHILNSFDHYYYIFKYYSLIVSTPFPTISLKRPYIITTMHFTNACMLTYWSEPFITLSTSCLWVNFPPFSCVCNALLSHTPHPPLFRGFVLPWRRYGLINGIVFIGLYRLSFPSLLSLSLPLSLVGCVHYRRGNGWNWSFVSSSSFKKRERGTAATVIENVVHILLIVKCINVVLPSNLVACDIMIDNGYITFQPSFLPPSL